MEIIRTGAGEGRFYLDMTFIARYELGLETFEKGKPFTAESVDDLLNLANEKYGLDFDKSDTPKAIYAIADYVVMVLEKSNQHDWESEENEELEIMRGIRELFCFCRTKKYTLRKWKLTKRKGCQKKQGMMIA